MESLPFAVQWFVFEDYATLELAITILKNLEIPELRTAFSWADWERPNGAKWFDHFIGRLYEEKIKLMPCLFYTPLKKARASPRTGERKTSHPPERLRDYADFAEEMIERYGGTFDWMQLWNESNWDVYWNWEMDPGWHLFAEMAAYAMEAAKAKKKKIVLGGLSPYEPDWTRAMFSHGVLQQADALGIHAFPGTWDADIDRRKGRPWRGLRAEVEEARANLRGHGSRAEVWLTETGYSTYGRGMQKEERERKQSEYFDELRGSSAERIYWHTLIDQKRETATDNELNSGLENDEKAYFFGLASRAGKPKPLFYHWRELAKVHESLIKEPK